MVAKLAHTLLEQHECEPDAFGLLRGHRPRIEPAYGLPNFAEGSSDSTVDVALDSLTSGEYAINLHMSDEDLATYTSCGDVS